LFALIVVDMTLEVLKVSSTIVVSDMGGVLQAMMPQQMHAANQLNMMILVLWLVSNQLSRLLAEMSIR